MKTRIGSTRADDRDWDTVDLTARPGSHDGDCVMWMPAVAAWAGLESLARELLGGPAVSADGNAITPTPKTRAPIDTAATPPCGIGIVAVSARDGEARARLGFITAHLE